MPSRRMPDLFCRPYPGPVRHSACAGAGVHALGRHPAVGVANNQVGAGLLGANGQSVRPCPGVDDPDRLAPTLRENVAWT